MDAAKGILIILVVLGHFLEATAGWEARSTRLPLTAIYLFHMPAFVFLAGITSKPTQLPRRIGTFVVMLVLFQSLYFMEVHLIGLNKTFSLLIPFWILWFLLAMCWWQLLMPLIHKFPKTSVVASLIIPSFTGTFESIGYDLTLSRTLVFLPFFVIGATYGQSILRTAYRLPKTAKIVGIAVAFGAWAYLFAREIRPGWLYGSFSFDRLKVEDGTGVLIRAGLMILAMVIVFTFLSLVPNTRGALATLGRRSLAVFALHGFLVLAVTPLMPVILHKSGNLVAVGVCLLMTALAAIVFAAPAFDRSIRLMSQRTVDLVLKPFASQSTPSAFGLKMPRTK
ncbi:acyltransferase family protein [Glutamicibacter halophytocola]|uniref:Acyltransferase family protein n=2 Tax=Micrococcaceae TaxID=1268 RepID=A0ABX5Y550_9MICC|nr:acyltransferase family protein [Glutamicibacter sp. FBE19]NQD42093.1 acyltransferase family protein [Glutamicibacter halophytocola]QDY65001.1 acyltransferase family protein [Glutamicibacter halophytocola]